MTSSHRWRWLAFAAALAATLMDLLDSTIATVAAPAIRADLGGSYADLQWITAADTIGLTLAAIAVAFGLPKQARMGWTPSEDGGPEPRGLVVEPAPA